MMECQDKIEAAIIKANEKLTETEAKFKENTEWHKCFMSVFGNNAVLLKLTETNLKFRAANCHAIEISKIGEKYRVEFKYGAGEYERVCYKNKRMIFQYMCTEFEYDEVLTILAEIKVAGKPLSVKYFQYTPSYD